MILFVSLWRCSTSPCTLYTQGQASYKCRRSSNSILYNSLRSLFELAFTGSPALVNLDLDFSILSYSQSVDFALWLVFYLLFIILSLILLLNLLIALLSFTFDAVRNESTLECRTSFAQCLMRLELQAASLKWNVNAGVPNAEGDYTYYFRSVKSLNSDPAASRGRRGRREHRPVCDTGWRAACADRVEARADGGAVGQAREVEGA